MKKFISDILAKANLGVEQNAYVLGTVGIGTASPYGRLELNGSGQSWTTAPVIRMWDSFNSKGWLVGNANNYTSGDFYIRTLPSVSENPGAGQQEFTIKHATGNVGIGTSSPGYKLDVVGDINFTSTLKFGGTTVLSNSSSDVYGNIRVLYSNSSINDGMYLNYNSSGGTGAHLRFFANGYTERMRIDASSGFVGIGTTSPTQLLHIVGINAANNGLTLQNTNASGNSQVRFLNTSGTERAAITYVNGSDAVYHYTAGGGNLLNLVGGNVGIGTTSPSTKLNIYSDTTADGILVDILSRPRITLRDRGNSDTIIGTGDYGLDDFFIDTYSGNALAIKGSTRNVGIGTTSPNYKLDVNGYINIYSGNGLRWGSGDAEIINSGYSLLFKTYNGSALAEVMRITTAGNVGIGTSNPLYKLSVIGEANVSGNLFVGGNVQVGTNTIFLDGQNNRLGIGTSNPDSRLHVGASNGAQLRIDFVSSGDNYYDGVTHYFRNGNGAANIMTLLNGGNVGIGTTSPSQKLHIYGTGSGAFSSILNIENSTSSASLIQFSNTVNGFAFGFNSTTTQRFVFINGGPTEIANINGATGVYTALSDKNKKKDFELSTLGLDAIMGLKPTLYRIKSENGTEKHLGFIAQEVKDFIPQAFVQNADFIGLTEMPIVAALTKAVQELKQELDTLKNK